MHLQGNYSLVNLVDVVHYKREGVIIILMHTCINVFSAWDHGAMGHCVIFGAVITLVGNETNAF